MRKYIASIVTCCRIFGSLLLLFFPASSVEFHIIYVICGISDMVDGTIARKISGVTQMGAKIDSVADIIFVIVSFFKILPTIDIPRWLWIWGFVIALVKIGNVIFGYVAEKQFIIIAYYIEQDNGIVIVSCSFITALSCVEI